MSTESDLAEVLEMVATGESEVIEFKTTTAELQPATRTLCGMANQRGGRVLYGIEPDGTPTGQHVTEKTLEKIVDHLSRVAPDPAASIRRLRVGEGREVIEVAVSRGPSRPYRYQ